MTRSLKLPDNVDLLPSDGPVTRPLKDLGVSIHGQGFPTAAVLEDLSAGYPHYVRGDYNIGLLHTCAGCEGHDRYAPCTVQGLRVKGYDYWALGHIHQRQNLHTNGERPIVFPGNTQGCHIRETGPKGCYLATVKDGRGASLEFRRLDVLCWEVCEIAAAGLERADEILDRVSQKLAEMRQLCDGRPLAVRVVIAGPTTAHEQFQSDPHRWTNEVRARAMQAGGELIWVEKVEFRTTTRSKPPSEGPIQELLALIEAYRKDETQRRDLGRCLEDLSAKLPPELTRGPDKIDLSDPQCILNWVQAILVSRLLSREAVQ